MKNNMNYELRKATKVDKELLIFAKEKSILDFAKDISQEELFKIKNYVNTTIPKQLKDYKVITINNESIGCLLIEKYKDGILVNEIYLNKDYRGQGIGTNILTNVLSKNSKVYLWVYKENVKAINLYQKLGFKIKEETETRYFMVYNKNLISKE